MQTFYKNCLEGLTMNIGVIDTGVNLLHKDLADNSEDEFISIMEYSKLIAICEQIQYKGTLIIAAFNNYNSATYTAAFPNVIGVDWDIECKKMVSFGTIPEIELQQFKERDIICYNMNLNNHSFDICEKLRIIGKPKITVIGTSSKQGNGLP